MSDSDAKTQIGNLTWNVILALAVCAGFLWMRESHHTVMEGQKDIITYQMRQMDSLAAFIDELPDGEVKGKLVQLITPRYRSRTKMGLDSISVDSVTEHIIIISKAETIIKNHNDIEGYDNRTYMDDNLQMGASNGKPFLTGVRFESFAVPKKARIVSAVLRFTVNKKTTGELSLEIKGQKGQPPAVFSDNYADISDREMTDNSVVWVPSDWNVVGAKKESPDLKGVFQEIVDDVRYDPGDAFVFVIRPKSGQEHERNAKSSQTDGPTLILRYENPE